MESLRSRSSLIAFDLIRVGESGSELTGANHTKRSCPKDWLAQWDFGEPLKLQALKIFVYCDECPSV